MKGNLSQTATIEEYNHHLRVSQGELKQVWSFHHHFICDQGGRRGYHFPTKEKLKQRFFDIEKERRNLSLKLEDKTRPLEDRLLSLINKDEQLEMHIQLASATERKNTGLFNRKDLDLFFVIDDTHRGFDNCIPQTFVACHPPLLRALSTSSSTRTSQDKVASTSKNPEFALPRV